MSSRTTTEADEAGSPSKQRFALLLLPGRHLLHSRHELKVSCKCSSKGHRRQRKQAGQRSANRLFQQCEIDLGEITLCNRARPSCNARDSVSLANHKTAYDSAVGRLIPLPVMRDCLVLLIHLMVTMVRLGRPGGLRRVVAESVLVRHQLLILKSWA